jgi:hypothetical protein
VSAPFSFPSFAWPVLTEIHLHATPLSLLVSSISVMCVACVD